MNFLRKMLATSPKEVLVTIPSGELFLARTKTSPKGVRECIFKDAQAIIRRTSTDYHYQLVVQRVYEEGEENLEDDDEESELDDLDNDDRTFLIDEALRIAYFSKDDHVVITWKDTSGDVEDYFEFVCSKDVKAHTFDEFDLTARKCQYERKYQKAFAGSESELDEFDFDAEQEQEQEQGETVTVEAVPVETVPTTPAKKPAAEQEQEQDKAEPAPSTPQQQLPKESDVPSVEGTPLCQVPAGLYLFDAPTGSFVEQSVSCTAEVLDLGEFEYWLQVSVNGKKALGLPIGSDMNPYFNIERVSFIFNYVSEQIAFSWLLKFENVEKLEQFQLGIMKALWEANNQKKWEEADQEYVMDAFEEMDIDDEEMAELSDDEDQDQDQEPDRKPQDERYDDDEEYDEADKFEGEGKNSQLAVGMSNDRSFVVRGNKIGVFKQTPHEDLEYSTTIDNVQTPGGKVFNPQKIMLHAQDSNMVMQDTEDPTKLYNMDLEYGKVVDEWNLGEFVKLKSFGPNSKFSQMTGEQTMVGMAEYGLFRVDPRLSGEKTVQDQMKWAPKGSKFSAMATNEKGNLAVASLNGDIRLYDRIGVNAKTHIPALGDAIIGIETSADGKWILATCRTYLLLIDATIKEGKNAGHTGFQKPFGKDSKPRPMRLQISPEHVAYMQGETGKPLSFTTAHFNTGIDAKEQTIVTSSGPYVITWSLKKLLRGDANAYLIKRYAGQVTADNFKFGTDKRVIVALEDDVGMVSRSTFRKPTRESFATPAKRVQAMSRNSIVNSPF